jgi:MerR family copper efflux transcriptional regulator
MEEEQDNGKLYRIGEVAELAGVSKRTVDYYTQLEMLVPIRTESNYRYYTEETLERLKLIELYKQERLSLEEIRNRLHMLDNSTISLTEVSHKIDAAEEKIREVKEILLELKPILSTLNENQTKCLLQKLSVQGISLSQLLSMLLG